MAIELFTGKPGAGKTHHAVKRAMKAIAEGRPVYVSNMNGMEIPGAIPFEDPRKWQELPAGALLIVDEAQRFWRATRSMEIPEEVQAMETHRHLGIDFLLTTQQPSYLLKHMRGLIMPHTHHTRLTKKSARTYRWQNRCVDDPEANGEIALAEEGLHILTPDVFKFYKSTEEDTHKPKIPKKIIVVGVIFSVVIGMFWYVNNRVGSLGKEADGASTASVPAQPGQSQSRASAEPMTTGEMLAAITPRVAAAPWSAPVFDERKAKSEPEVYCMASEAGIDARGEYDAADCSCKTEQGTDYWVKEIQCRAIAKSGGVYNPYRQPRQNQERQGASEWQTASQEQAPAVAVGTGQPFGTVAAYGSAGVGAAHVNAPPSAP